MSDCMEIVQTQILAQRINSFLEKGQDALGLEINEFAERFLDCRPDQLAQWKSQPKKLPIRALSDLCQKLNLSLECVFEGRVDYDVLFNQYYGNLNVLPQRYTKFANSKARTIKIITDYCRSNIGDHFQRQVFRYFQISEKFIQNENNQINLNLVRDLLAYVKRYQGDENIYYNMGLSSVSAFAQSPAGPTLSVQKKISGLFQCMFEDLIHHIELNCDYRISKLGTEKIVLDVIPKRDIQDALATKRPGSWEICQYKKGIISSLPLHISWPRSEVEKTKCIHRGDARCTYEVNLKA